MAYASGSAIRPFARFFKDLYALAERADLDLPAHFDFSASGKAWVISLATLHRPVQIQTFEHLTGTVDHLLPFQAATTHMSDARPTDQTATAGNVPTVHRPIDPLFEQVAASIRALVDAGSLVPGDRAPSLRANASHLNVSVATVVRAYEELEREGILEARARSGYFLAQPAATSTRFGRTRARRQPRPLPVRTGEHADEIFDSARGPGVVPFGVANPSPEILPSRALNRALRAVCKGSPTALIEYAPLAGEPELRREIAARASRLGTPVEADDVIVTAGATEALALALRVVARPGDTVVVESPAYFGLLRLLETLGLAAIAIETHPEFGLEPNELESVLVREPVAAVVSIATFNNPTGSLVPDEARRQIVDLCARHDVPLIEDDLYADLHYGERRPLPYKSFDPDDCVMTCSSYSKTIAPGFRIGWVASRRHRDALLREKLVSSGSSAPLTQRAMARFLAEGRYDRHVAKLRRNMREQLGCLRAAVHRYFPAGTCTSDPRGGFVLWVRLPGDIDAQALYQRAIVEGISLTPGALFSQGRKYRNHLRLAAGEPWIERHEAAIQRLGELASQ